MRRCAMARHPMMRLWLAIHVELQRIHARWLAHGAEFTKRLLDIVVALALLALACPLLLILGLLIKLEDSGPVFFAQTRIGQDGREFKMFKVRSMVLGAEQRLADLLGKNKHSDGVTFKI
ncbi:MAG TPA: sugar transferase, partial [Verrucomicrobiae bacterium]|nr:sugar transferase [Verrucomicrobiae bacterium]